MYTAISQSDLTIARDRLRSDDALLVLGYAKAMRLPVSVPDDRHAWNLRYAEDFRIMVLRARERHSDMPAEFDVELTADVCP